MKNKYKILIAVISFLITSAIFSDWVNFKAGLAGMPPVTEVQD